MNESEIESRHIYCPSAVTATYTPQRLPHFQQNPLIEALPKSMNDGDLYDAMTLLPKFEEVQRDWTDDERIQMLMRLNNFLVPSKRHVELARAADSMLRSGYCGRAPRTPEKAKKLQKIYEERKETNLPSMEILENTSMISTLMMGVPGMGKTTSLKRLFSHYPQVIYHPEHHIYQVPYLHLEMPSDGSSVKGLAFGILRQFDKLFPNENYFTLYTRGKPSAETLMQGVGRLLDRHCVGILIADEVQNLTNAHKGKQTVMTEMVSACNDLGVPILFVGTNKAVQVFSLDFRNSRRGVGYGIEHWDRLEEFDAANVKRSYSSTDEVPTSEWQDFLEILWTFQWVKNPVELEDALATTMYDLSQGVIDIAIKIFASAQAKAISNRSERITVDLLLDVFQNHMAVIHPMIDALRQNIARELMQYPDIAPIGLKEMFGDIRSRAKTAISKAFTTKSTDPSFLTGITTSLMGAGFEEFTSVNAAKAVQDAGTASNLVQGVSQALANIKGARAKPPSKRTCIANKSNINNTPMETQDYRNASEISPDGLTTFEKLQRMGAAKPLEELIDLS